MVDWLRLFKKQNQVLLGFTFFVAASGVLLFFLSLSGTKYAVTEYCFRPEQIKNPKSKNKFCVDSKKYVAPSGWFNQERYTPANPRFRDDTTFILSPKATRLREIPPTNPNAEQYATYSVVLLGGATFLVSRRLKRYKREFPAFFEQLKTDLKTVILSNEQDRELTEHSTLTYTQYIKDKITRDDQVVRYQDKSQSERQFESEQADKHNELIEYQRQIQIAQFKAQLAKIGAEEAKYQKEIAKHLGGIVEPLETVDKIDFEKLCPPKQNGLDFYDWRALYDDAVGIIIAGNSGSGKTSVAVFIAGLLTSTEPAQIIALDPHANINVLWGELDIFAISDFYQIEMQFVLLVDLLDRRRGMTPDELEKEDLIIIFADEINAQLENFKDPDIAETAFKRLGSEGRKYKIVLVMLNQSSNCNDIGISRPMRSNYLIIFLNASARQKVLEFKKEDERRRFIESQAYSCIISGSAPDQVAIHPTHGEYKVFKKKGNKPKNLLPINQLTLTIELAVKNKAKEDWHEDLVTWAKELGRIPNFEEIKQKWAEIMGAEPSVKQIEMLQEYLINQ